MYYYISGELVHTERNMAVIDAGGVGYKLTVSSTALGKLAGKTGKVKLYTYLSVRDDALELYGFYSVEEASVFRMLITVSGVGPKAAMSILSTMSPEQFALAVTAGDAKALSKAPGVGPKTAARIILELKDKLSKEVDVPAPDAAAADAPPASGVIGEAQNALLVLGYSRAEAMWATKDADPSAGLEAVIREALRRLMKG
ncbi:MAG: Holliday junction branch migration protein RuvA [Eubacteriales bacterium]|jgi:Holliday junction DNA helicase RuvA|nr:Holliday junction branch migration protein RuvA [Clostridiales bacterium]